MPGNPKKRAKREAERRGEAEVGQPVGAAPPTRAGAHNAGAGGRASPAADPAAYRYQAPGPELRGVADRSEAHQVEQLAAALQTCLAVDIHRTRPNWCSGWIESYPIDADEGIGELKEYLRDEYGGQTFKITAVTASNVPIFTAKLDIMGPPKEGGKVIDRETWNQAMRGERTDGQAAAVAPAHPTNGGGGNGLSGAVDIFRLILEESRESRNSTLNAVREMTNTSAETERRLLSTIVEARENNTERQSFGNQLGEVVDNMKAVEQVRTSLTPKVDETDAGLGSAAHEAGTRFLTNFMESEMGGQPNRPAQTAGPQQAAGPQAPYKKQSTPEARPVASRVVGKANRKG